MAFGPRISELGEQGYGPKTKTFQPSHETTIIITDFSKSRLRPLRRLSLTGGSRCKLETSLSEATEVNPSQPKNVVSKVSWKSV